MSSSGLRVWILQAGEELPIDPGPPRLLRHAILGGLLAERGHDVTFWSSSFNHQQKVQRCSQSTVVSDVDGYRVVLLASPPYRSNVSLARIQSHRRTASEFRRLAVREPPPDVLLAGYPTIELAHAGVAYASERGVPSVVDCRDLWPEIIEEQSPGIIRVLGSPVLAHWRRMRRELMQATQSVVGITDEFVEWGVAGAGRPRGTLDVAFPLAIPRTGYSRAEMEEAGRYWTRLLGAKSNQIWGVYAGSLGRRTDLMTVVKSLRMVDPASTARLRVIVCGRGDLENEIRKASGSNGPLVFAGKRSGAEVRWLLDHGNFGILPYHSTPDYAISYPNKVGEYLAHGLPVLTGLEGVTAALLREHALGVHYVAGDQRSCAQALVGIVNEFKDGTELAGRALAVYQGVFNPDVVYPAFADHLESVARLRVRPR